MTLVTDYYRKVLEAEHSSGEWGQASKHYVTRIAKLMKWYNLQEVLDYGAGSGNLAKNLSFILPNVKVHNYEPGIAAWNAIPKPCNMVACIDVIEHIEPECLDSVLNDLERVILKYAFISISTKPAKRILNNGWNAHICLKRPSEWKSIFEERFNIINCVLSYDSVELELHKKDSYENS